MPLPIEPVIPDVRAALGRHGAAVLHAPPGAGKTTLTPLALREADWLGDRRIVMLEPRRLAARSAARRMARTLGEQVGETVGYRVRMDTRVGARTRIEVVTEGVLTRMLQSDPGLEGVGCVIFDEFHERNLQADLGLALCLDVRAALRPDLRLLVMSATLEGERVAALLGNPPVIVSEGRRFPVETHYLDHAPDERIETVAARAVRRALAATEGDVLVFLPGAGEIRRTRERLSDGLPPEVDLAPLYGSLPLADQDRAIDPSPPGRRKVVLSTDIAESSLTIEGVRVVVDAGLMRVPRFDPNGGMTRLATIRVSKASADQRRGRAGRLGPGACYRLWTAHTQQHLVPFAEPEIREADLAPLALELAHWGASDPSELRWLDPPPDAAYAEARRLLRTLDALDEAGRITAHGRALAELPLHPRLAHMVLRAHDLGLGATAGALAALLSERDVLRSDAGLPDVDLRLRLEALRAKGARSVHIPGGAVVDRRALRRVRRVADQWRRRMKLAGPMRPEAAGLLLAFAYPDRIGQLRQGGEGRFRLRSGRVAVLATPQLLSEAPFVVAAHLDGRRRESLIYLAAPIGRPDIETHFADQIETEDVIAWDPDARRVGAIRRTGLGAIVLKEGPIREPDPDAVAAALVQGLRIEGVDALPWTKACSRLRERLAFMHHADPAYPDVSDAALLGELDEWLGPHLFGMRSIADVQRLDLARLLLDRLDWSQRAELETFAPTHLEVPSGSRIPIDYSDSETPVLAVRLQELFGLTETPRIGRGQVPLTMHLLSPAHRPVQVTQDLESFWARTYFEVKKDLAGRYPKHHWPDNPLTATPTRRSKPRRS